MRAYPLRLIRNKSDECRHKKNPKLGYALGGAESLPQNVRLLRLGGLDRGAIVRLLLSVHSTDKVHGTLTASDTTPCEALREGIDLIVMAPGKGQ
jgi:hypothetical protein